MKNNYRDEPRPCLGYGDTPCPHGAVTLKRYSKRCKSCAARQRLIERPNHAQLEAARRSRFRKWWNEGAYETAFPFRRAGESA